MSFELTRPEFAAYTLHNAPLKRLATGFDWAEGPVWFGDQAALLFSDIPNNRILRWSEDGLTTFRAPSNFANGHTRDAQGRLISCQHGTRSVTRTEWDGSVTTLADSFDGKPLNSPNDVVTSRDGAIWFTDPHYGIQSDYEGFKSAQHLPCHVYRLDPDGGLEAVITDMNCPNGLCFDAEETQLYVADSGRVNRGDPLHIRVYDMVQGRPQNGRVFHKVNAGLSDGMRMDGDGNLWSSAGDGVHCISPDGRLLGKVLVPEVVSNICFGGRAKNRLFITATTSLYAIYLNLRGIQTP